MKRKYRLMVFESASSAIHSLVISEDGMQKSELVPDEKTKKIRVPLVALEQDYQLFASQLEKISFLASWIYYCYECHPCRDTSVYDNFEFRQLDEAVFEYTGYNISIYPAEELMCNHQFQDEIAYFTIPYVNIYDIKDIQNFIFNKYIAVEVDSD